MDAIAIERHFQEKKHGFTSWLKAKLWMKKESPAPVDAAFLGGAIPIGRAPSVVTRVYLPPFEEWERRDGPTCAFRAAVGSPGPLKSSKTAWTLDL